MTHQSGDQQGAMTQQSGDQQDAMTQSTNQTNSADKRAGSAKLSRLKGKIGDDGKTFTSDKDGKSWTIENPDAVKGHEGHDVKVRAHVDTANNSIHVMSVKMAGERASKKKEMPPMSEQPPKY